MNKTMEVALATQLERAKQQQPDALLGLISEVETAAQRLEDMTPVYLNWHLLTGEIARDLRAAIAKAEWRAE